MAISDQMLNMLHHDDLEDDELQSKIQGNHKGDWVVQLPPGDQFGGQKPEVFTMAPLGVPKGHEASDTDVDDKTFRHLDKKQRQKASTRYCIDASMFDGTTHAADLDFTPPSEKMKSGQVFTDDDDESTTQTRTVVSRTRVLNDDARQDSGVEIADDIPDHLLAKNQGGATTATPGESHDTAAGPEPTANGAATDDDSSRDVATDERGDMSVPVRSRDDDSESVSGDDAPITMPSSDDGGDGGDDDGSDDDSEPSAGSEPVNHGSTKPTDSSDSDTGHTEGEPDFSLDEIASGEADLSANTQDERGSEDVQADDQQADNGFTEGEPDFMPETDRGTSTGASGDETAGTGDDGDAVAVPSSESEDKAVGQANEESPDDLTEIDMKFVRRCILMLNEVDHLPDLDESMTGMKNTIERVDDSSVNLDALEDHGYIEIEEPKGHSKIYWPTEAGQAVVGIDIDYDGYDTGEKGLHRVLTYLVAKAWTNEDDIVSVDRYVELPEADGVFDVVAYKLGDDGKEVAKLAEILTEGGASKPEDITTHMDDMEAVVEERENVSCEFICENATVAREQVLEALDDGGYVDPDGSYKRTSMDKINNEILGDRPEYTFSTGRDYYSN